MIVLVLAWCCIGDLSRCIVLFGVVLGCVWLCGVLSCDGVVVVCVVVRFVFFASLC